MRRIAMKSRWLKGFGCFARLMLISVFLIGCAGQPGNIQTADQPDPSAKIARLPIPDSLKEKINLSEGLGWELYIHDKAAALGTDVMLENLDDSQKAGIRGYIVLREGNEQNQPTGSWLVYFFSDRDDPRIAYQVRITPPQTPGRATTKFDAITPPRKPMEGELAVFRAVRNAIASIPDRPNQSLNPVAIPAEATGEEGILVYLLAATKKENVVVFGKHYRVLMSKDGQSVNRIEPLTKTVLESPIPPGKSNEKPAALFVTHLLGDYPLETHVFISRLHHLPLFVSTEKYLWRIDEGKIELVRLSKGKNRPKTENQDAR